MAQSWQRWTSDYRLPWFVFDSFLSFVVFSFWRRRGYAHKPEGIFRPSCCWRWTSKSFMDTPKCQVGTVHIQWTEKVNYHLLCVNILLQAETSWVIIAFCLLSVWLNNRLMCLIWGLKRGIASCFKKKKKAHCCKAKNEASFLRTKWGAVYPKSTFTELPLIYYPVYV